MVVASLFQCLKIFRELTFWGVEFIVLSARFVWGYIQCVLYIFQWIYAIAQKIVDGIIAVYQYTGIAESGFQDKIKDCTKSIINFLETIRSLIPIPDKVKRYGLNIIGFAFWMVEKVVLLLSATIQNYKLFIVFALLVLAYKLFGQPLMYLASDPQAVYNNIKSIFFDTSSGVNLAANTLNIAIFIFKALNFFARLIVNLIFQLIVIFFGSFIQFSPSNGVPRELSNFRPSRPELASHVIAHRQLLLLSDTPSINSVETYTNDVFIIPDYSKAESIIIAAESPLLFGLAVLCELTLFFAELIKILSPALTILPQLIFDIGSIGCCFVSAQAFGYCVGDFFLDILAAFVRLFTKFIPGLPSFDREIADLNLVKKVSGAPCNCNKRLPQVPACKPDQFTCETEGSGESSKYTSHRISFPTDDPEDNENNLWRAGSDRSVVCQEYIAQEKAAGRALLESSNCKVTCFRGVSDNWKFKECDGSKTYLGACDRNILEKNKKAHLLKYMKLPFVSSQEKQLLLTSAVLKRTDEAKTTPNIFLKIDKEKINGFIKHIEDVNVPGIECSYDTQNPSFEQYFARSICLLIRYIYSRDWKSLLAALMDLEFDSPHVRSLLASSKSNLPWQQTLTHLFAVHIDWYNKTYNEESLLVKHADTVAHISSNVTNEFRRSYHIFLEGHSSFTVTSRHNNLRGSRELATTNLNTGEFSASGPNCPYLCPDGITCVSKSNIASCEIPSSNWTSATVIRTSFHTLGVAFTALDFEVLIKETLSCWYGYIINPAKNPATFGSTVDIMLNGDYSKYDFCAPLIGDIPYVPVLVWSLEKYVEKECGTSQLLQTSQIQPINACLCPSYDVVGIFDYYTPWTPFSYIYVKVRLYNAVRGIQYVLNAISFGLYMWISNLIYNFLFLIAPTWVDAFSLLRYNTYGSDQFCFYLYIGNLLWFLIYIVFPFYFIFTVYWDLFMNTDPKKPRGLVIDIIYFIYKPVAEYMKSETVQNHVKKGAIEYESFLQRQNQNEISKPIHKKKKKRAVTQLA